MEKGFRRFGVALFGVGRIGVVHLKNILAHPGLELRWIVEADINRAHGVAKSNNLPSTVGMLTLDGQNEALEDPDVDFVMICTPSFTHEPIVRAALTAEKAVFCEKPLAPSLEAVQSCYELATKVSRPLFCAFNRRWDPQLRELKRRVSLGQVGRLRVIKSVSRDPPGMATPEYIKSSGGIFVDTVVHDLDLVCWLAGEAPRTVYATGDATNDLYKECNDLDSSVVVLHFQSGIVGIIENGREAPVGFFQHVEVFGNEGMIQSENQRESHLVTHTLEGVASEPIFTDCTVRYKDSYVLELDHFVNVLRGEENIEVTEDTVVSANALAERCRQSANTKSVVEFRK